MRRSTWIKSIFARASWTSRIFSSALAGSIDCCMTPTVRPSATMYVFFADRFLIRVA
jgi:hypothetical protein